MHVAFDGGVYYPANHTELTSDWQFVAVVYDGVSIRHYVDDRVKVTVDSTDDDVTGTEKLRIGGLSSDSNWDWDGLIDNVFVYNGALTRGEINHIRTHGVQGILNLPSIPDTVWDFETGDLSGWNIVNTTHGENKVFTTQGNMPTSLPVSGGFDTTNVQGDHFIWTFEGDVLVTGNGPTGIIQTEEFVLAAEAQFELWVGGGNHSFTGDPDNPQANMTAVNLERKVANGNWEMIFTASGGWQNSLSPLVWDASAYAGQTVRLRIYDTRSGD